MRASVLALAGAWVAPSPKAVVKHGWEPSDALKIGKFLEIIWHPPCLQSGNRYENSEVLQTLNNNE